VDVIASIDLIESARGQTEPYASLVARMHVVGLAKVDCRGQADVWKLGGLRLGVAKNGPATIGFIELRFPEVGKLDY
jgi:hypothetical protein